MNIYTPRLRLVPVTAEHIGLEMSSTERLAQALSADVPANWPPEQMAGALPFFLAQLTSDPGLGLAGWLNWYALCPLVAGQRPLLIGSGGFFGRPQESMVEVGYSVLPQFQGQGFATEIVGALVAWAFSQPSVRRVAAETSSDNVVSLHVLSKLGFTPVGEGRETGSLRFEQKVPWPDE